MDTIKDTILKDLKDSDFVMETPSAAIFTLVVGMDLTFVIICYRKIPMKNERHI